MTRNRLKRIVLRPSYLVANYFFLVTASFWLALAVVYQLILFPFGKAVDDDSIDWFVKGDRFLLTNETKGFGYEDLMVKKRLLIVYERMFSKDFESWRY